MSKLEQLKNEIASLSAVELTVLREWFIDLDVAAVTEAVQVSPAVKAELEARLAEFEANPDIGYSWDEVESQIKDARNQKHWPTR